MLARLLVIVFYLGSLTGCLLDSNLYVKDISQFDFQEGDILLQHIPESLCSVIADVTNSQYSNCGIVVKNYGQLYVLEAIGPVEYTSINRWINKGFHGKFTQIRVDELTADQVKNVLFEAEKFTGRPYDFEYNLDDDNLYCSELIYKAFRRGAGITLGKKEALGSLNWKPNEMFIRRLSKGEIPLDREIITPDSLVKSSNVKIVYSTFSSIKKYLPSDVSILFGAWEGEYTIQGMKKVEASLAFKRNENKNKAGYNIEFDNGYFEMDSGFDIKIRNRIISSFKDDAFEATLSDIRGIKSDIKANVRDNGNKIIGTWKDDIGFSGVFSMKRI